MTTTTTDRLPRAARSLSRGAGLLLVWVAVVACNRGDSPSATSAASPTTGAATPATAPATPGAGPAPTASPVAPASTLTPPDGATVLQQALGQLSTVGYHFVTTGTTADGQPAVTVEGDTVGGTTQMIATSQGETLEYVVLPEGTWVMREGVWNELEEPIPASDPIGPLMTATSVSVVSHTAEATVLVATYPASSIVPTGDEPLNVTFELTGTTLRALAYTLPASTESSRTDFSPLALTTPITSPSA